MRTKYACPCPKPSDNMVTHLYSRFISPEGDLCAVVLGRGILAHVSCPSISNSYPTVLGSGFWVLGSGFCFLGLSSLGTSNLFLFSLSFATSSAFSSCVLRPASCVKCLLLPQRRSHHACHACSCKMQRSYTQTTPNHPHTPHHSTSHHSSAQKT